MVLPLQPLQPNQCSSFRIFQVNYNVVGSSSFESVYLNENESSKTIHFLQSNASYNLQLQTCLGGCANTRKSQIVHVTLVPGIYMYM